MIDDAERLDAALNRRRIGAGIDDLPPALRAMVDLAVEVGEACSREVLSAADRDRIHAEVMRRVEARRTARGLLHRISGRRAAVIGGAAAVTAVAAAIGVRALIERRGHAVDLAAA